jgi:hypothetical protein
VPVRSLGRVTPRCSGCGKIKGPVSVGAFRILISPSELAPELGEALSRSGCLVEDAVEAALLVQVPAPTREQAERELRLYVASWPALNEDAEVDIEFESD